jgi:hypothetical protein
MSPRQATGWSAVPVRASRLTSVSVVLVLVLAACPALARAQTTLEGVGGYDIVDYEGNDGTPVGWFTSFAAKPSPWFALVSQFTVEYENERVGARLVRKRAFTFLDGPRITTPSRWRTGAFFQLLVGVAHIGDFFPERPGDNRFMWQPGVGVDFRVSDHVAVRFQASQLHDRDGRRLGRQLLSGLVFGVRHSADVEKAALRRHTKAENALAASNTALAQAQQDEVDAGERLKAAQVVWTRARKDFDGAVEQLAAKYLVLSAAVAAARVDLESTSNAAARAQETLTDAKASGGDAKRLQALADALAAANQAYGNAQAALDEAQRARDQATDNELLRPLDDRRDDAGRAVSDARAALDRMHARKREAADTLRLAQSELDAATRALERSTAARR